MRKTIRCLALALALALLLAGCGLIKNATSTNELGKELRTLFFAFAVEAVSSPADYEGYTPAEGDRLVVCTVRVENTFGETLPMYDTDFQLQWGEGDGDWGWSLDAFTDSMMPLEWELPAGAQATYDLVFEVPADASRFQLAYLEQYVDEEGNEGQGDLFWVDFAV